MKIMMFPALLWFTLIVQPLSAQVKASSSNERYHPLKVGDTVPNYSLINLINYPAKTAKISDFKGKLLILNFWDSHCSACVAAFPKLMDLQKEFDGKLQIVLINGLEDRDRVRHAFQRRKEIANVTVTLPTVCRDTMIQELFPYSSVPHIVWIDPAGRVISMSQEGAVNRKNIGDILAGKKVAMVQEIDNADMILPDQGPIFIGGNGGEPQKVLWYSIFAKGDKRLNPTWGIIASTKLNYYEAYACASIKDIYRQAYGDRRTHFGIEEVPLNRTVLQVKDTTQYVDMINGEFYYDKHYVYQLIAPHQTTLEGLQKMMQADLKRYVGLNVRWAKRKMKCFVLTAADTSLIVFKGGKKKSLFDETMADINDMPMADFIGKFEDIVRFFCVGPFPIVDETGFKGMLGHISLNADFNNIEALNRALAPYKLKFNLEERVVNVLVLSEPGHSAVIPGEISD